MTKSIRLLISFIERERGLADAMEDRTVTVDHHLTNPVHIAQVAAATFKEADSYFGKPRRSRLSRHFQKVS